MGNMATFTAKASEINHAWVVVDAQGKLHRNGVMRLASAMDEIAPMRDARVRDNQAYLTIVILSRVISRLGDIVEVSTNSGVFVGTGAVAISTSQSGGRFFHSFAITGNTTGQITITPGVTFDAGSFVGTITVNGCSNAFGPCNHVAGSPKTITVTWRSLV